MRRWRIIVAVLLWGLWGDPVAATTNTYQEGVGSPPFNAAVPDTYLAQYYDTTAFGNDAAVYHGVTLYGGISRSITEFNISDIAAGSTVSSSTFTVYITTIDTSQSLASHLYRMIRTDWGETTATWNVYKTGSNWTTAGCGSDGNDYSTTNGTATFTPAATGSLAITGLATLAQDAIDSRSGILRMRANVDNEAYPVHYYVWSSSEDGTSANRPKLEVIYTAGGGGGATPPRRLFLSQRPLLQAPLPLPVPWRLVLRKDPGGRQTVVAHHPLWPLAADAIGDLPTIEKES